MTLTPEQFNLLATKEDVREFKDEILTAADKVMKKLDDIEHAFV